MSDAASPRVRLWQGLRRRGLLRLLGPALFWSWNGLFLLVGLGLALLQLGPLVRDVLQGDAPPSLLLSAVALALVPLCCVAIVLRGGRARRTEPAALLRMLYGVEAPLLLLLLFRVVVLQELTGAQLHLLLTAALSILCYGHGLAFPAAGGRVGPLLRLAGHTLGLLCALHLGALLLLYVVPAGALYLRALLHVQWLVDLVRRLGDSRDLAPLALPLLSVLMLYTATLICPLPVAFLWLYGAAFRTGFRTVAAAVSRPAARAVVLAVVAAQVALWVGLNRQPQSAVLLRLSAPPRGEAELRARIRDAEALRAGLLNAYLAPQRYLEARSWAAELEDLLAEALGLPRRLGAQLQRAHNVLAAPLLYDDQHGFQGDRAMAERLYAEVFDAPIEQAERAAVRAALAATYDQEQREAGLLATQACPVQLVEQSASLVAEADGAAEVELHEVYENQTAQQQEIRYHFSLPEAGVVTGLWLQQEGSPRHGFLLLPRGAAGRVYQRELGQHLALLEQVGPRQYRLRVFPLAARPSRAGDQGAGARRLHLWLRYAALAQGPRYPLPVLGERRNVCWGALTRRAAPWPNQDAWWPASLPATQPLAGPRVLSLAGYTLRTVPAPAAVLPDGLALAVVLDRSYSMERVRQQVGVALEQLRRGACARSRCDLFLTSARARGEPPARREGIDGVDPSSVVYYGGQRIAELLAQQAALAQGRRYHAVLVLTDEGSLELAPVQGAEGDPGAPVCFIHLGGALAPGYDDRTLATIQRHGGAVVTDVPSALSHLALLLQAGPSYAGRGGGLAFYVEPGGEGGPCGADPFSKVAAGRVLSVASRGVQELPAMDRLHALAQACGVVMPYSSMIVGVSEAQQEALQRAAAEPDRFDR
ncbi:MAG: TIGR02921 family PEP-CTERM protein [Myxococcota bacterium]|nr:TIGR02921 family PEP-CTERM protein [Myxococcota bacterium]